MSGHSISLSLGLSIGFHVIAISGASFVLPNSHPNPHGPIEVMLVELSEPTHEFNALVPSVDAVEPTPPTIRTPESKTTNNTVRDLKKQDDDVVIPAVVEEPAAGPASIAFDSHALENAVAQGDQVVALPANAESPRLSAMQGIMRPDVQYLSSAPPRYPRLARKRGWEGTVLLKVEVLSSGDVGTIRVAQSSGHKLLDRAATRAVQAWRFSVNQAGGAGITAMVEIPVTFKLDSQGTRKRG